MMSNAIDFVQMGVVDDSEEPAVYTTFWVTFCHAHICPSQS